MTRTVEDLIRSSYSDLAPSFQVEDELMANLPTRQAPPRRRIAVPIAAIMLIGTALAVGKMAGDDASSALVATEATGDTLTLATVARPRSGVVPKSTKELHVRIVAGGGIRIIRNKRWTEVSLDELGAHLAKAGTDRRVVLSADRNTPWQHVQWIAIVCAERRMPNFAFAVRQPKGGEFYIDATLPTDLATPEAQQDIRLTVQVLPREERETTWGAYTVRMPTGASYKCIDREADELASVARWMSEARRNLPPFRVELKARPKTRFETAARLLAEFHQAGIEKIDFFGTPPPTAAVRAARVLPYPGERSLMFDVVEGDAADLARTGRILRQRLDRAGFDQLEIQVTTDGIRIAMSEDADDALVRQLVERKGTTLAMHITVERDDPVFANEWRRRELSHEPGPGLRWYALDDYGKKNYQKSRLPKGRVPLVLCRIDPYGITNASLSRIEAQRDRSSFRDNRWVVAFQVRKEYQQTMADLTQKAGTHMAIILDGKVHSAPNLLAPIRSNGQISGSFSEREAKALATLLRSEPLPITLALRPPRR